MNLISLGSDTQRCAGIPPSLARADNALKLPAEILISGGVRGSSRNCVEAAAGPSAITVAAHFSVYRAARSHCLRTCGSRIRDDSVMRHIILLACRGQEKWGSARGSREAALAVGQTDHSA